MSLNLLQRTLGPILRRDLFVCSLPTLSPSRRWYRSDYWGPRSVNEKADAQWRKISDGLPYAFKIPDPEKRWSEGSTVSSMRVARPPTPFSGRSVKVLHGDIADATRKLDRIMMENNVWRELRLTQRHEKKGAKRRRLSSERWRTRFKDEVRKKVELVKQIRRRGS